MAYSEKQKQMRRCRFVKKDKSRCKAFAKIGGEKCALHSVFDAKAPRPKKNERAAAAARRAKRRAQPQRRAVCNCSMLPYPHRFNSTNACPVTPVVTRRVEDDDRAYGTSFARDEVQYESAREVELVADDEERVEGRRHEADPLVEERMKQQHQLWSGIWSGRM